MVREGGGAPVEVLRCDLMYLYVVSIAPAIPSLRSNALWLLPGPTGPWRRKGRFLAALRDSVGG